MNVLIIESTSMVEIVDGEDATVDILSGPVEIYTYNPQQYISQKVVLCMYCNRKQSIGVFGFCTLFHYFLIS